MVRPRHSTKELESVLAEAERKDWRVIMGGNGHYKMYCPCEQKHMKTVSHSPSSTNYLKNLLGQLNRATCWGGDTR